MIGIVGTKMTYDGRVTDLGFCRSASSVVHSSPRENRHCELRSLSHRNHGVFRAASLPLRKVRYFRYLVVPPTLNLHPLLNLLCTFYIYSNHIIPFNLHFSKKNSGRLPSPPSKQSSASTDDVFPHNLDEIGRFANVQIKSYWSHCPTKTTDAAVSQSVSRRGVERKLLPFTSRDALCLLLPTCLSGPLE